MALRVGYIVLVVFALLSCKKSDERECWKSTGETDSRIAHVATFVDSLFLNDGFLYRLIPDSSEYIVISGGAHVIPFVEIEELNGRITVTDRNTCNFLRSFKKKIEVEIHLNQMSYLRYTGGGEVVASDTLHCPELRVFIVDGAGPVSMTLESGYTEFVIAHGYGDFTLKGKSLSTFLNCQSNGFCDTRDLITSGDLRIRSSSSADMRVNAQGSQFFAEIYGRGSIRYSGFPNSINATIKGTGALIPE